MIGEKSKPEYVEPEVRPSLFLTTHNTVDFLNRASGRVLQARKSPMDMTMTVDLLYISFPVVRTRQRV